MATEFFRQTTDADPRDAAIPATLSAERLAEIAHELRTPLGGIAAMADAVASGPLLPAQRQAMDALLASVQHLRQVAGEVLDDYRSSRSKAICGRNDSAIDLTALFTGIGAAALMRAAAQGGRFRLAVAESVPRRIIADGTQLRQMVENLLDNALKVSGTGEVCLEIDRIGRRGRRHRLRVAVRDNGPGFTAEEAERIFEPFHRLDESLPGTGIGLALVKRFAEAMQGDVFAQAAPGGGAIVGFTVSVQALESPAETAAASPASEPATVLVVDDNAASRMVITVVLEQFGLAAVPAACGEEALQLVRSRRFDAIIMDMTMAGMDGLEATRALKAMPSPAGTTPVIALTGRVAEEDREAFLQAGASAFVPKPLSPRMVFQALKQVGVVGAAQECPSAAA